jgi:ethanolamine utilization protein EutA
LHTHDGDHLEVRDHYENHDDHDQDGHDHIHDDEQESLPLEERTIWIVDNIELKSVGIDIGSSCTRIAFSKIKLRRNGIRLSSRYDVVSREISYQSQVKFTPYSRGFELIDELAIARLINEEYQTSGLNPSDIDTGVVLLTGEAIRRRNAEAIAKVLSLKSGKFVTVAAGHNQEALLAAHGSGAVRLSRERKSRILNLDVGGGTTKFSLIDNGEVIDTCAIAVGGRLVVYDDKMRLDRLEPSALYVSRLLGFSWEIGREVKRSELDAVASWMADAIIQTIFYDRKGGRADLSVLAVTPLSMSLSKNVEGVVASGGVGEYVYGKESRSFNDLGKSLGEAIRDRLKKSNLDLLPAAECIRATVIGVSEYTIQLSGNTIFVSDESLLPLMNLQVLKPNYEAGRDIVQVDLENTIKRHFAIFDLTEGDKTVALMFHWKEDPSYERLSAFAQGIFDAMRNSVSKKIPLILVFDQDVGRTIGAILKEEKKVQGEIICIDGILLQDFDFIDIGKKIQPSGVLPVTVKSLAFENSEKLRP